MTKYEWERELRKNIKSLPSSEIDKILDYYGELFEDKAESGLRESDIINEFGNPFDVARRIVNDYEYANGGSAKSDKASDKASELIYDKYYDPDDDRPTFVKKMTVGIRRSVSKVADSIKKGFSGGEHGSKEDRNSGGRNNDYEHGRENNAEFNDRDNDRSRNHNGERFDERREDERYDKHYDEKYRREDGRNNDKRNKSAVSDDRDSRYIYSEDYETGKGFDKDYDSRNKNKETDKVCAVEDEKPRKKRGFLFKLFKFLLLVIPVFVVVIVLVSVGASLFAAGIGCIVGGAAQAIAGLTALPVSGMVALSKVGLGAVVCSLGMIITIFSIWFIKLTVRILGALFGRKKKAAAKVEG